MEIVTNLLLLIIFGSGIYLMLNLKKIKNRVEERIENERNKRK